MRCKIDDGTLDHINQSGYSDTWRCRRCKVIWKLEPIGDEKTEEKVIRKVLENITKRKVDF